MHPPKALQSLRHKEWESKDFLILCLAVIALFAVGSCTALLRSGDQGEAVGVWYYIESLFPAIPKGSPAGSRHNVASGCFSKVPTQPCSKAQGNTFFCPSHPLSVFLLFKGESGCCASAADNVQILTALCSCLSVH